uniref:HNH endonuclease n=1 Tax=Oceanobacillus massiliensis TaxID=1465765 RepID=UPI0030168E15
LERDHYICHYCGFHGETIDHKTPRSKGGLSTPMNCVCCCNQCNLNKADMGYEDYLDGLVKYVPS